ncbi:hypothetical protein FACS1894159_01010 [Bacteroidia bacterium]|nr:hypothetical protein FACS1894159_01010 [Bacteroidia bacterium]
MKKTIPAILAMAAAGLLISADLTKGPFRDMSKKEAFKRVYPQYFAFRGEMSKPIHKNYEVWSEFFGEASGLMRKLVLEEIPINTESSKWANKYAAAHPEKLVMMHLNGEARQVAAFPEVLKRYFPGHWVYQGGSKVVAGVKAADNVIKVADAKSFTLKGYIKRDQKPYSYLPQHVIIVRLDEKGNKLWYESEYATVAAVDYKANTVTLERGQFFSKPLDFGEGKAYMAPVTGGLWGNNVMWFYNLSLACPRDRNGRQAWEVFADEIVEWLSPKGPLENVEGIAFDVNYFDVTERGAKWDTDNDGKNDGGWVGEQNQWRRGDWQFLARLRERLGPDFILSGDAHHPTNQQALGIMNGMESEGLVQHDDMWRGISRTINTHLYWKRNNKTRWDYRYVVLKMGAQDEKDAPRMRRFATAMASCLEACVTMPQDRSFMPAQFEKPGSMGMVNGPLVRYATTTKEMLTMDNATLAGRMTGQNCEVAVRDGKILITAKAGNKERNLKFTIDGIALPAGELTFFMNARATDPLDGFTKEHYVPRMVWLRPEKLPDYGEGAFHNNYFTSIYGMISTHSAEDVSYYFRRVEAGVQNIQVEIQGNGGVEINSLRLYNAPDVVARRFDKLVVIVNPSMDPVDVNPSALFPEVGKLPATQHIPAIEAAFIPI